MRTLTELATTRLVDEAAAYRLIQLLCYAAGPLILVLAVHGLERAGATHAEFLIGILAAVGAAATFVATGTIFGLLVEVRRR